MHDSTGNSCSDKFSWRYQDVHQYKTLCGIHVPVTILNMGCTYLRFFHWSDADRTVTWRFHMPCDSSCSSSVLQQCRLAWPVEACYYLFVPGRVMWNYFPSPVMTLRFLGLQLHIKKVNTNWSTKVKKKKKLSNKNFFYYESWVQ